MVAPPLNGPYRARKPHSGAGGGGAGGLSSWSWLAVGLIIFGLSFHLYTQYLWLTPPVADGTWGGTQLQQEGEGLREGEGPVLIIDPRRGSACLCPCVCPLAGRKGTLSLGTSGGLASLSSEEDLEVPPLFIVGTHHKTGTALMALILR